MQTVKTAAIVVLMMTVLYGAYVSITTPPEPVPPEVAELLEIDDKFGMDDGLPESLKLTDIEEGTAGNMALDALAMDPAPTADDDSFGASFSDRGYEPLPDAAAETPATPDAITALAPTTPINKLPATAGGTQISTPLEQSYPSTGNKIDIPDPESVSFDPAQGAKFDPSGEAKTNLKSLAPPVSAGEIVAPTDSESSTPIADTSVTQASAVEQAGDRGLANAFKIADGQYAKDRLKEALATLSVFYNAPNATAEQRAELLGRLDPLARQVIYSKRHLLEQPYRVARGETLPEIAGKFGVPWQLLANINGINDPMAILPGTELKIVRGPFSAQVDLKRKELTLFLGDLYAGRFPIEVGSDPAPKSGSFTVQDKQTDRTFYSANGAPVAAGSPGNPYGSVWLDLGDQLCIHGSPHPTRPTDTGCISLPGDAAGDLFGILSQGSSVTIRR